jgi:hypothetical protein
MPWNSFPTSLPEAVPEEIDYRVGPQPGLLVSDPPAQYRPRHPERTTVYRLFQDHFDSYVRAYEERFEPRSVSVSAIFDGALFKVFDGLTKRVAAAAGLVPRSVPLLAWETGTGTAARVQFYLLRFEDDKT